MDLKYAHHGLCNEEETEAVWTAPLEGIPPEGVPPDCSGPATHLGHCVCQGEHPPYDLGLLQVAAWTFSHERDPASQ